MKSNFTIGVDKIEKRRRCLSSTVAESTTDIYRLKKIAQTSIERNSPTSGNDVNRFISEAANFTAANKYHEIIVEFVKTIEKSDYATSAAKLIASNVVPYIVDLKEFYRELQRSNIFMDDAANILEHAIHENSMCDNILRIHESISSRFNIEGYLKENSYVPVNILVLEMCTMIDTFEGENAEKFRASLEEISYLFDKLSIPHDNSDIVQYVTEYYLHRDINSTKEIFDEYKMELEYCHILTDNDLSKVRYFVEEATDAVAADPNGEEAPIVIGKRNTISDIVNTFKISPDKREESFYSLIDTILKNYTPTEILDNLNWMLTWMLMYVSNELYQDPSIIINALKMTISRFIDLGIDSRDVDRAKAILTAQMDSLCREKNNLTDDGMKIMAAIKQCIATLDDYNTMNSSSNSVKQSLGVDNTDGEIYKLESFTRSAAYSTILSTINETKNLLLGDNRFSISLNKNCDKIMITEKSFEDSKILDCITENGVFDHTIAIYDVRDNNTTEMIEEVSSLCRYINNRIPNGTTHLYYESLESIIEIHVEDTNIVDLNEAQMRERDNTISESEYVYFGMMENLFEIADTFDGIDSEMLAENYRILEPDLTGNQVYNVIDLAQYTGGLISKERVLEMADSYRNNHPDDYFSNGCISNLTKNWKSYNVDLDVMAEAVGSLNEAILNEIDFKVGYKNNNTKEGVNEKNSTNRRKENGSTGKGLGKVSNKDKVVSGNGAGSVKDKIGKFKDKAAKQKHKEKLSLNTLKMAAVALKGKAKDLDAKSKKISDDIDAQAERFMNAVKELYSNDNRESVIKGSIIPSFHKLFQRGVVGVAGTGVIALFNPTYAVVAAALYVFSLIAVSKHNTEKERALLLDEINIELDVLEKELANAESRNQMKRYRQLVTYKKKLMRERQRIKYKSTYHAMVVQDNPDREQ